MPPHDNARGRSWKAPRSVRSPARVSSRYTARMARRGNSERLRSTTVIAVRREGRTAIAADGQVTLGDTVLKHGARKLRRLADGNVVAGFAGSTADAQALFGRFEAKLQEYRSNLERAAVELAKEWRTDRALRRLDALLVVADKEHVLLVSGNGDLIEPDDGILAIGSGGPFALAAARALVQHTSLSAAQIAEEAMRVAASICVYTNDRILLEEL
jgi:ATP-dependent HslUV protease, peptidase subunit HslV